MNGLAAVSKVVPAGLLGMLLTATAMAESGASVTGELPPNPKPGECYARVVTPAKYAEKTETIVVKEASQRVKVSPAQVQTVSEPVTLKEESTRLEIVPAVYETVQEKVEIKPERTRLVAVPATYKTVSEQVMVSPAHTQWHHGTALGDAKVLRRRTSDSGDLMCLVEVPAVYKTVTKTVVDRAAGTTEEKIPAEYKMVTKQVVKTPATTREVKIPAVVGTVQVTKVTKPAAEEKIDIPAVTKEITKRELVTAEKIDWHRVVCAVNLNKDNTLALQKALQTGGYYKGPLDGIIGSETITAANSYAKTQDLPSGANYIVHDVVEKLGLSF